MTEQIIIDGVDVSGCKHFENEDMEMVCGLEEDCTPCRGTDCYYKQAQFYKQECDKLIQIDKELLETKEELIDECIHLRSQLHKKTTECEELKNKLQIAM